MDDKQARSHGIYGAGSFSLPTKQTSMCSLIIWNISKALEKTPSIDLTRALRSAHDRLESKTRDESKMISQAPGDRHLTCALLAWHQLGRTDVDGLCKFIEENRSKPVRSASENIPYNDNNENINKPDVGTKLRKSINAAKRSGNVKDVDSTIFDTNSLMGPVVKLPVETIVMRFEPPPPCQHHLKKPQKTQSDARKNDLTSKIDAACCMESACIKRLAELDSAVKELRARAGRLARREAERVAVLERAEAAWKDLELGFQRRLSLAEEKEDDIAKQIKKTIEERNSHKNISMNLADTLKERGEAAEKERERLKTLEKEVCDRACIRLRLSEESSKGDAALAELLCRVAQLDRDLQFKEEQARRKVVNLESELESSQCLTLEAERAMRFELSALKEQVGEVSEKLLAEENNYNSIKAELEQLREEKSQILEDLDGCKDMCEARMSSKIDELSKKKQQLKELQERVIDCQCKLPLDVAVEVKRTPSLAALCYCTPEDKILESCSCTSLRSQLLSNLLADLFGGLQAELGESGLLMPCGLLLCLDDRHNWDRASAVKSHLRNFFSQLLVGELDIAIATSIEKYHATWVGESCADKAKLVPDPGEEMNKGWEKRAIERRAQSLAAELAEKLYEERAESLKRKFKEIVAGGPPPCECKGHQPAVFPCLVKTPVTTTAQRHGEPPPPPYLRRTLQGVTHLRHQIEDLKKESIKKEDLRHIEEKIAQIIQRISKVDYIPTTSKKIKCIKTNHEDTEGKSKACNENCNNKDAINSIGKLEFDINNSKKCAKKSVKSNDKNSNKMFKKLEQSFAVNLCLCSDQEAPTRLTQSVQHDKNLKTFWKNKNSSDFIKNIPSVKQTKPINATTINRESNQVVSTKTICPSDCICFHKIPSNTSIDKLLETLSKWNGSLIDIPENTDNLKNTCENKLSLSNLGNSQNSKAENDKSFFDHLVGSKVYNGPNEILPTTTESEYIGAINLEKSNYNICRCPKKYKEEKTKHGDAQFQCINAGDCDCKRSIQSGQPQKSQLIVNEPSKTKNVSQMFPIEMDNPQFKCIGAIKDSVDMKNRKKSEETFIHDLVRKSELFPNDCDYFIKFLGVTLANTNSLHKTKQNHDDHTLKISSEKSNKNAEKSMKDIYLHENNKYIKSSEFSTLDNCEKNKTSNKSLNMNEDVCVCCNIKENSNDLELNAFNLLEDHIREKLGGFLRSSCKSSCIPPEEENKLFGTILKKVKDVVSEGTKDFNCKCNKENTHEGSWLRAYGMLQEYLKVKINRVQCSCITREGKIDSILPSILNKVCDLIENDFQRLKEKCKCDNEHKIRKSDLKSSLLSTEDNIHNKGKAIGSENYMINTKTEEKSSCVHLDKSCEVLENVLISLNTSEKNVSCEFKIYGTDCNCKNKCTESSDLGNYIIVNQCTELIPKEAINNVQDKLSKYNEKHMITSSAVNKHLPQNENNEENIEFIDCDESVLDLKEETPYIGCTFSRKSIVQNEKYNIDNIWKSLTNEITTRNFSYIMLKAFTNEKSENNLNNILNNNCEPCSSNPKINCERNNIYDIEVSTFDDLDEDVVLKCSNDNCYNEKNGITTYNATSVGTKNTNNDNASCMHDCGLPLDNYQSDVYDKQFLYDSLHLPAATDNYVEPVVSENATGIYVRSNLEDEKCDCKLVPICHVKMLVNNIEKKLIEAKCTCDSLNSQVCPVHS